MKLLSVNVSRPREISHDGKIVRTGIFKQRIEGRVMPRELNLESDGVDYVEEPLDPPDDDAVLNCCSQPKTKVVIDD